MLTVLAPDRPPAETRNSSRDEALFEGQRRVLELLARGAPLTRTLTVLCEIVEERNPRARCSVLLLDADTGALRHGAAPRLPPAYCAAIDGVRIGPSTGSCGTAAFERREVIVEDIASDPLWERYRDVALPHGLAACASVPIFDAQREVLGTFAVYHAQPSPFDAREIELLRDIVGLATIAIEAAKQSAALFASEERFRLVSEQTGQVIYDSDLLRGTTVWAGAIEATFGDRPEDFGGLDFDRWCERIHPADRVRVRAALERAGGPDSRTALRLAYRVRHRDGSFREIEQRGVTVIGPTGAATRRYGVLADVTERRRTEAALRQAQKLESLGALAGGLAHDFNNLLTTILANLNLAELKVGPGSPALPFLKDMDAAIVRASALTRQMLAYSGRGLFVVKPIDMSLLVQEMAHLLSAAFSKKISVCYRLAEGLPAVEVDVAQLQQVVMNLVTNAAEAIGDVEGTIGIRTDVCELDPAFIAATVLPQHVEPGRHVLLEVSDSGSGMSAEVMARIFDPFFSTKRSGRGLGLSAMLGILRAHHAGIQIRSEVGSGSTFTVFFPATALQAEPTAAERPAEPALGGGVALVVDDEPSLLHAASTMLRELGYETIEASDGFEAVERFRRHHAMLALVLMDLTMPRMSGKEAFRVIREIDPTVPILLSSGYSEEETAASFRGAALTGFLQKPYHFADLKAAVRAATTVPRRGGL